MAVIEDLPHDILVNILQRLPVKSALRTKSTCKLLYRFISDPIFAQVHRDRALSSRSNPPGYLYKLKPLESLYGHLEGHLEVENDTSIYFAENGGPGGTGQVEGMKIPFEISIDHNNMKSNFTRDHASSGGLMALFGKDCYCSIYNPVTQEKVQVPSRPPLLSEAIGLHQIWWGFGFSLSNNEYKIVQFSFLSTQKKAGQGAIYTVKGYSDWKVLENDVPFYPQDSEYVECNGTLFWVNRMDSQSPDIGSFDIVSEEFQGWRVPFRSTYNPAAYYLIKIQETVGCVWNDYGMSNLTSIWILRDKINQVWIKEYTFAIGSWRSSLLDPWTILYLIGHHHCTYYSTPKLPFANSGKWIYHIFPHVGSLISPKQIMAKWSAS